MSQYPKAIGWLLGVIAVGVYLLTLSPTVSYWDCGEFIATGNTLMVGHAPGAPFYSLVLHLFSLLGGCVMSVAWWCNALSAFSTALTVSFLYWSLLLILPKRKISIIAASIGALCFLFCDTVWSSAVETEVYSFAVLMVSIIFWAMLRWRVVAGNAGSSRWLVLVSLLLGLSLCVHLLCLLVLPAVVCLYFSKVGMRGFFSVRRYALLFLFFVLGLTPYLIVPIRAAVNPPINCGNPSSAKSFVCYVSRGQYEKQPIYPRIWRHHYKDEIYASDWSGGRNDVWGNVRYTITYQMCYMYLRYFMWNFSGRFNNTQGYGSLQNGQFVTGFGAIDRCLVGTNIAPPNDVAGDSYNVYFLLPFILGVLGILSFPLFHRGVSWAVMLLFLFGGVFLAFYLNMQAYEPRERDYVFVLSFYAFAIYIAMGAYRLTNCVKRVAKRYANFITGVVSVLLLGIPMLMAVQNWDDHDMSNDRTAYYSARNLLNCCSQGSVLFTYGDNDTFPLWYMQQVEGYRTDVTVYNINLLGSFVRFFELLDECRLSDRSVYFSHYVKDAMTCLNDDNCFLSGYGYKYNDFRSKHDSAYAACNLLNNTEWNEDGETYHADVSVRFLESYWRDVLSASSMAINKDALICKKLMAKALQEIPPVILSNDMLRYEIVNMLDAVGLRDEAIVQRDILKKTLCSQLKYYATLSMQNHSFLSNMINEKKKVFELVENLTFIESN